MSDFRLYGVPLKIELKIVYLLLQILSIHTGIFYHLEETVGAKILRYALKNHLILKLTEKSSKNQVQGYQNQIIFKSISQNYGL